MKKLLFLLVFLLGSCGIPDYTQDPSLKESERIAVLQKAQTDTTTIVVEMDKNLYIIKNNTIEKKVLGPHDKRLGIMFLGLFLGLCVVGFIAATTD